ncbi:MAG TPA: bis(5'-nucleosyl)-tetraphosphatase (symmetrical) YqeK [Elainellaceae cyanobacterium]
MGKFAKPPREKILEWLETHVPKPRIDHVLRVEALAIALAKHHSLEDHKAAQAGLMHDLAKYFKPKKLLAIAKSEGIALDAVYETTPHLLHADVSAIIARNEFSVSDPQVLDAIANHTLGKPGMDALSCIVFLADSLEPGRGDTLDLNHLRHTSQQDLAKAVWMTCDYTFKQLIEKGRLIHPRAVLTRNWFLQSTKARLSLGERSVECSQNSVSPH